MFNFKKSAPEITPLQGEINRVHTLLDKNEPGTPEYIRLLITLERLTALKPPKKDNTALITAFISAGASLGGIGAILGYEKFNVLTSKAVGFVVKPKS